MKKISFLLLVSFLITFSTTGKTQNDCYIQLGDLSGFNTAPYQAELEAAACELIQAFPSEFQEQFKVYSFGFYAHNEYMQGGFDEIWNKLINRIKSETPYYIISGLQLPDEIGNAKIWLEVNLPNTGSFSCIDDIAPGFRSSINYKIQTIAEIEFAKNSNSPNSFFECELQSISALMKIISNIVNCCNLGLQSTSCATCIFNTDEVTSYLEQNDFIKLPITVASENKIISFDCGSNSTALREKNELQPNSNRSTSSIINYTDYNIYIDGESINIESLINTSLGENGFGNFRVYIMDYENIMNNTFFERIDEVRADKGGLIYFIDNFSPQSHLYISPTVIDINLQFEQGHVQDLFNSIISSNDCEGCPEWMLSIYNTDYSELSSPLVASTIAPSLPLSAIDGPLPIAETIIAAASAAIVTYELTQRIYITYIAHNPTLNQYYCGRTSGFGTPDQVLNQRIYRHHAIVSGFTVTVDKSMQTYPIAYWSIRGREKQNIDFYGGAKNDRNRTNATCANAIRAVWKANPYGYLYHWSSSTAWGEKFKYTGYGPSDINYIWEKIKQFKRMKDWITKI